jgi:iron(III) transport system permease protein
MPWTEKVFKITLPTMRSGIFAGVISIFIWSFTEFGVPLIFDCNLVVSGQIYNGLKVISDRPLPFALVNVILLIPLAFYIFGKLPTGNQNCVILAKASHASSAKKTEL